MKNKTIKVVLIVFSLFLLTGCTQNVKDKDNKPVTNEKTGQTVTKNVICRPTDSAMLKIYEDNNIDISKLPECKDFTPITEYEGLWTSLFVKPLAWVLIKLGTLVKNYGIAIMLASLLIRLILMPFTKKTAMQSENMKKAQPELAKLEKKYKDKTSTEDQQRKAQEMMVIYKKYDINPVSGCLVAFIQLPLLFAFLEAINRTPAIFEGKFLCFELGTTATVGFSNGQYYYAILIILIMATTYFSFNKTMKDQSVGGQQMKLTLYFMLVMILVMSFTLPTALGLYWIVSSLFTILQNIYVEKRSSK